MYVKRTKQVHILYYDLHVAQPAASVLFKGDELTVGCSSAALAYPNLPVVLPMLPNAQKHSTFRFGLPTALLELNSLSMIDSESRTASDNCH